MPPACIGCSIRCCSGADEFDILHFHLDFLHFPTFRHLAGSAVTTLHGRLRPARSPARSTAPFRTCRWSRSPTTSAGRCADANLAGTVHHGLPARPASRFGARRRRLSRLPRPDLARKAARTARSRSRAAPACSSRSRPRSTASTRPISTTEIEPLLDDPLIEFVGEIGEPTRPPSSAAPARCCSRSTGPSRSAW